MNQTITIICDTRETRSGVPDALRAIEGVTVEIADLLSCDYAIGNKLGIERKTATDFVASILDNRLFEQCARMQTEYEKSLVLIEGDVYNTRSVINAASLDGALSYLALLSGVSVLHTSSVARTAPLIYRLATHYEFGLGYEVPLRTSKPKDAHLGRQFILEGLPGVGGKSAKKLLEHFGTVGNVINASEVELCKVKGIGPSVAKRIVEAVKGM